MPSLANPTRFLSLVDAAVPWLTALTAILFAAGLYLAGAALTAVSPWFGIGAAALVALFWFLPRSPLDRWLVPR